jgi:hypothetical protein
MDKKPRYCYSFQLNEAQHLKTEAVKSCGYTIPAIFRLGLDVALQQTRKTDGKHLLEREE